MLERLKAIIAGIFLPLALVTLSWAQAPSLRQVGAKVAYNQQTGRYGFTVTVLAGMTAEPEWVVVDLLGTTRAWLASVNGVLDRLGPDTAFVKVRNVWAMPVLPGDPGYEPGKYVAFYELPADKTLPPDGLLIVHAEALSADLEADGMSEIFNLSESRTDTLVSLQANYAQLNMAAFLQTVQLKITGAFSLGAVADLTAGVTGTVYESSNPAVVTVTADGAVIAMGNGDADLTITNSTFSITIPVHVDFDLFLTELRILPVPELDRVGAEGKLRTLGILQNGSTVDLSAAFTGIYYTSADPLIDLCFFSPQADRYSILQGHPTGVAHPFVFEWFAGFR